jgi:ribosomal protein L32
MNMDRLKGLLGFDHAEDVSEEAPPPEAPSVGLLYEKQVQTMESDISILDDDDHSKEKRLHREAEKAVLSAAEDSLKRLHMVQMGRCPECGAHLMRHLFASICDKCGWHEYEAPRAGPIRVHLKNRPEPVEGDRAYIVKPDSVLVVRDEVVVARVNQDVVSWIEYGWSKDEIDSRHHQVVNQMSLLCGWCNQVCDPDKDGFHAAQVAFGSTQERYTFCSDDCYEAFRRMYPSRVDRNCYEHNCSECNLCVKRYDDETDGIRLLAKDYVNLKKKG